MIRSMRTWMVALLLAAALVVALVVMKQREPVEQRPLNQTAVELRREPIKPVDEHVGDVQEPSLPCPGAQLEVVVDTNTESVCLGALMTKHNGSVRSHQVATLTTPQRWLRVEFAGSTVLSAAWGSDSRPEFHCQADECKGITISRRDATGARVMTLERTRLIQTQPNETPQAQAFAQLSGQIAVPPEELSQLACAGQGVSIVTSDSSSQTFCPRGGAGFEIGDDGSKRYRFTSLDGDSIVVATDQDQGIRQVRFEGELSLACRSFECGSVRISAVDDAGARRFTFAGTTLVETDSGQSNAVLNGSLVLPPL